MTGRAEHITFCVWGCHIKFNFSSPIEQCDSKIPYSFGVQTAVHKRKIVSFQRLAPLTRIAPSFFFLNQSYGL